jgi:1-acyl-sn-glycerol-3-phosphate acyltransferase
VLYRILRFIAAILSRLIFRHECIGLENFPDDPPYLLVSNHLSAFDSPLVMSVCPHTIRAFAASKHKRNPLFGPLLALAGAVWVRRGEVDRQALREALELFKRGEALGVAPEGTRARGTIALREGKTGAAYLAARADVPIVPVGLAGTENVAHNLPRLRRTPARVVIGEPFRLPGGRARGQTLHEYTDLIMRRIAELLPEEYRGMYG